VKLGVICEKFILLWNRVFLELQSIQPHLWRLSNFIMYFNADFVVVNWQTSGRSNRLVLYLSCESSNFDEILMTSMCLCSVQWSLTVDAQCTVVTAFIAGRRLLKHCFVQCYKNHYPTATDSERCCSTCWWTWQVWSRYVGSTWHTSLADDPVTNWV